MQHSFISLIPDSESIAKLKKQTVFVIADTGLANKNINQFFHLTLLDINSEDLNPEIISKAYQNLNFDLKNEIEFNFELIKHNKNKYLYCAVPIESLLLKEFRNVIKTDLQKSNSNFTTNNSGSFLAHITLINNINPYQKFLISKKLNNNQSILIKFKAISIYKNRTVSEESSKFDITF